MTDVEVGVSQIEVAEEQIKVEEQQRVLGVLPNFYVSYIPDAAPLTSKQKFKLAFRTVIDPFTVCVRGGRGGGAAVRRIISRDTGKARKDMRNDLAPAMATRFRGRLSGARFCRRF
jgi:hypothetical protein